ncbi:P-protein [Apiospora marii]|uniref:p-protein n=1 Tax=Apiospora marii TaxID=335849 RepID=A0ABR1S404_9PEZI
MVSRATLDRFPEDKYELLPVVTIKDVFDTTQSGRATYGVVPFENSTNGSVVFTLDHFADRQGLYPDLSVCAEIYLDVHHCLLGRSLPDDDEDGATAAGPDGKSPDPAEQSSTTAATGTAPSQHPKLMSSHTFGPSPAGSNQLLSAANAAAGNAEAGSAGQRTPTPSDPAPQAPRSRPLVPLTRIERIYSHPQAFGQCNRFLSAYLKGVETVDVSSTSRAAELARDDPTGTSAAISSAAAARLLQHQGVEVLAYNIEDREDNTTRFFVLRSGTDDDENPGPDGIGAPSSSPAVSQEEKQQQQQKPPKTKSLLSFTVPHTAPGALADVLSCFRAAGLNLTSIASRPSLRAPFQYVFFVEFEGHRSVDPEGKVARVLEQVGRVAESSRWLGSWVNQRC